MPENNHRAWWEQKRNELLGVAEDSIDQGLRSGKLRLPVAAAFSDALRKVQASFVTLRVQDNLRGCIGTLDLKHPLIEDVARNAFGAAFAL